MKTNNKYRTSPAARDKFNKHTLCTHCFRPPELCICSSVKPFHNKLHVLILQHPAEQFKVLNSARLAHLSLKNSSLFVGLSWPGFKALTSKEEIPSLWGILYLKSESDVSDEPITVRDRKNQKIQDFSFLRGIVAIDGSWKQAKALWWRNPWMQRLNRISLNLRHPSLRAQAKAAGLSTVEAIAYSLEFLGEDKQMCRSMIECYRAQIIGSRSAELGK